jgi:hypothetical protein
MREAIHLTPALRMQDSHYRSVMEGLFERASIYEFGECDGKCGHEDLHLDYWFFSVSPMVRLWVGRHWCCSELFEPWYAIPLWRIVAGAFVLNWLQPGCISGRELGSMPRKRGVPRRGSNWYARKEQRQRREQLERALVMATSMLKQKARAEEKALLSTIAEREIGCSNMETVKLEDSAEQLYPACIVEEDLTLEDLSTMEAPSDSVRSGIGDGSHTFRVDAEFPGCIVEEEAPWQSMETTSDAGGAQGDEKQTEDRSGGPDDEKNSVPVDGGDMHGFLLREEHLSLVFELRGHMADLEHRALVMGQRLDVLIDAYSGAPSRRKCPLCAQSFAIPVGSTWKNNEDDRSPIT